MTISLVRLPSPPFRANDVSSDDINPEIGITGTPVIDPSTNIIYVSVATKELVGSTTYFVQRLHAINIGDGTDAAPSFVIGDTTNGNTNNTPIYVSGTGDGNVGGVVQFNALREADRPALSLVNGEVYAEWASHGDDGPYHGWVVAWNVTNLSNARDGSFRGPVHRPQWRRGRHLGRRRRPDLRSGRNLQWATRLLL